MAENVWRNKLICGDNLLVMGSLLEEYRGRIDLIYSDPPFNTGTDFSVKFKIGENGDLVPTNFWDTKNAHNNTQSVLNQNGYTDTWGAGIGSYGRMMHERILIMRALLADDGHFFLHCDWHANHILRLICDEIFSPACFKCEIVWQRARVAGRVAKPSKFDVVTDTILFYSKDPKSKIKRQSRKKWHTKTEAKRVFRYDEDAQKFFKDAPRGNYSSESIAEFNKIGRIYWTKNGNPRVKTFLNYESKGGVEYVVEEQCVTNLWTDLSDMMHARGEATGYPTQKPQDLLERIILSASEPGALVADVFCGSGTTLAAAEKLNRRWIGVDVGRSAISITQKRLLDLRIKDPETGEVRGCQPFVVLGADDTSSTCG